MKRTLQVLSISLLFLAAVAPAIAADGGIEVIQSDADAIRFVCDFEADLSNLSPLEDDSVGGDLGRVVLFAMPYGSEMALEGARGSDLVTISSESLPESDGAAKPRALVTLGSSRKVRGRQIGAVVIRPLSDTRLYQQVEVRLRFVGGMKQIGFTVEDPQFERLWSASLINWDQARHWPKPARAAFRPSAFNAFGSETVWYRIYLNQDGVYVVTASDLDAAGLNLNDLPSDHLRLFNGGGLQLPVDNAEARPEFTELAIEVRDGGDGYFNESDSLLFFGHALQRWVDSDDGLEYVRHHYDDANVYWLSAGGTLAGTPLRIAEMNAAPTGSEDTTISAYRRRVHLEKDSVLETHSSGRVYDFYRWYWIAANSYSAFVSASQPVVGQEVEVEVAARTFHVDPDTFSLAINGYSAQRIDTLCEATVGCTYVTDQLVDGLNEFSLTFGTGVGSAHLDYIEFDYLSEALPLAGRLDMMFEATADWSALVDVVDEFGDSPLIWLVTPWNQPSSLIGWDRSNGAVRVSMPLQAASSSRLMMLDADRLSIPDRIERTEVADMRGTAEQTDLIIVTADHLVTALEEYADYREGDGLSSSIVTVDDIYDNFAWGLVDPTAIRDFLKFAYENYPSPAPTAVLFAGDGTYDFLDHQGFGAANYVPPYISEADAPYYVYGDDNYVYFGDYAMLDSDSSLVQVGDRGFDMLTARWPVQTADEVADIINKTRRYEESPEYGSWRSKVALVADDEFAEGTAEIIHTTQTESVSGILPADIRVEKIYAIEHEFVNRTKPTMNDAIVDAFNDGALLVNYVGHGNPSLWAHELVFTTAHDLPRLDNPNRLPLVFAASCAIGHFDEPEYEAMAELLLADPDGGAIATISAMRLVYSGRNHAFNKAVIEYLFGSDNLTMAEALYAAKLRHQYEASASQVGNDRAYILIGDPYVALSRPTLAVEFLEGPDSLVALQPARVSGRVVDGDGELVASDGLAEVAVYDSDRRTTYVSIDHGGSASPITYKVDGPVLFRGDVAVSDGAFEFEFIPPLDVGYGGRDAGIEVYVGLTDADAVGVLDSISVAQSVGEITDSTGPDVSFTFDELSDFVDGDPIDSDATLRLTLFDSSGINLTGALGHGIVLTLDGDVENTVDLTELFQGAAGDYTTGTIEYGFTGLARGEHEFKIKVWDNANNSAVVEFTAVVSGTDQVVLQDLLNYPNPMADSTSFAFYTAVTLEHFSLEIFTLSGRRIQSFDLYSLDPGYHDEIVWRGRDFAGDRVATGVYIYQATARGTNGESAATKHGKVVVVN